MEPDSSSEANSWIARLILYVIATVPIIVGVAMAIAALFSGTEPDTQAAVRSPAPPPAVASPSPATAVAPASTPAPAPAPAATAAPVASTGPPGAGDQLIAGSDCVACHRLDVKLVGPSYQAIANRYQEDPEAHSKLVQKVQSGGAGNWGPIPMAPHPTLSPGDISAMVTWILDQKTGDAVVEYVAPAPVVLPEMKPIVFANLESIPVYEARRHVIEPLAPLPSQEVNAATAELGRFLFFDPRLSGDTTVSCATCHDPAMGFGDGEALGQGYPGALYFRNTPTLINATLQKRFMWDGRLDGSDITTLCRDMITESHTMNMDSRLMQERLKQVPEYLEKWKAIFGEESDPYGPKLYGVVGEFVKTLRSRNVPLDRLLKGDGGALNEKAKRGLQLFSGKANCIQCHNGAMLSDGDVHATGVPENPDVWSEPLRGITILRHYATQGVPNYMNRRSDLGHYIVTKDDRDIGKFKTAPLRDLKFTAPYMHNGAFKTLAEVVEFYDRGGGETPNKDPLLKPLKLSGKEKADLLAFLESLSGDPPAVKRPDPLPEYKLRVFGKN